jgi:hypothetical protein
MIRYTVKNVWWQLMQEYVAPGLDSSWNLGGIKSRSLILI